MLSFLHSLTLTSIHDHWKNHSLCCCWNVNWYSHYGDRYQFTSIQLLSHVRLFVTPWTAALQASLSITNSRSLLKFMPIESVTPSNHLILCHPLLLPPSIFSSIRVFSNESALHIRWPPDAKSGEQYGGSLKAKNGAPYDPEIPLLGIYLEENMIQKGACTRTFIAALFIIAKTWKKPKCPLTNGMLLSH